MEVFFNAHPGIFMLLAVVFIAAGLPILCWILEKMGVGMSAEDIATIVVASRHDIHSNDATQRFIWTTEGGNRLIITDTETYKTTTFSSPFDSTEWALHMLNEVTAAK